MTFASRCQWWWWATPRERWLYYWPCLWRQRRHKTGKVSTPGLVSDGRGGTRRGRSVLLAVLLTAVAAQDGEGQYYWPCLWRQRRHKTGKVSTPGRVSDGSGGTKRGRSVLLTFSLTAGAAQDREGQYSWPCLWRQGGTRRLRSVLLAMSLSINNYM